MNYVIVLGVVAPKKLAAILQDIHQDTGCTYASVARSEDPACIRLLHSIGLHDQAEIYQEFLDGEEPNPANPPGRSTHEMRSDGVPYPGPVGRRLAWWQCGMDVDDAHVDAFIAAAWNKHRWVAFRPYGAGSEFHHVNLRKQPTIPLPFLPLHEGSHGPWVTVLRRRLRVLKFHEFDHPKVLLARRGAYSPSLKAAVQRFQRQHHLTADGVVGPQTWLTLKHLAASKRRADRRHVKGPDTDAD